MTKYRPILNHLLRTALIGTFAGLGAYSQGAVLVDFGPSDSYVSGDVNYARTATESGSGPYTDETAFSDTAALSPSSGYSGPTFYGGYRFDSTEIQSGFNNQKIRNNYSQMDGNDTLFLQTFRTDGWGEGTFSFAMVYVFKQADFNAPYSAGSIKLNGMSTTFYQNTSGSPTDEFSPTGRWLIQIDNTYYLSQATIDSPGGSSVTVSINESELTSTLWAVYDPTTSLLFDAGSASFESVALSDITSVGVYFGDDSFTGTSNPNSSVVSIGVSEFSASGIPEPDYGMLLLPILIVVGFRQALKRGSRR